MMGIFGNRRDRDIVPIEHIIIKIIFHCYDVSIYTSAYKSQKSVEPHDSENRCGPHPHCRRRIIIFTRKNIITETSCIIL